MFHEQLTFNSSSIDLATTSNLQGDRILLPSVVLEKIKDVTISNSPIIFQLYCPKTQLKAFASVREFSAPENIIVLSLPLMEALHLTPSPDVQNDLQHASIAIKLIELQKATFVSLHALNANFMDIPDIREALEAHLRLHYSTLTVGHIISFDFPSHPGKWYPFLVHSLKPESREQACLIVDTDLEVDIVPPLNNETELASSDLNKGPNTNTKSSETLIDLTWKDSMDGANTIFCLYEGILKKGEYSFFRFKPKSPYHEIILEPITGDADIFVSEVVEKPTLMEHSKANFDEGISSLPIYFPENADMPFIYVGIRGYAEESQFRLRIHPTKGLRKREDSTDVDMDDIPENCQKCSHCGKAIPEASFTIHSVHCERNYQRCEECQKVFKITSLLKHKDMLHTPLDCICGNFRGNYKDYIDHQRKECPDRVTLCRFCHLKVKQGGRALDGRDMLLGITHEHEATCGGRTIECKKCSAVVRLKDVQTHHNMHEYEKLNRPKPFVLCANWNCSYQIPSSQSNILQLCPKCFGPFYSPRLDEGNKKLIQKVVTKYFDQLTKGCGKAHCWNKYCCTSQDESISAPIEDPNEAAVKAMRLFQMSALSVPSSIMPVYYFCVTEATNSNRRYLANSELEPLGFEIEFCVEALQMHCDDAEEALEWLRENVHCSLTS